MLACHFSIRTRRREVLARDFAERRALARLAFAVFGDLGLLAFRFNGHHGHLLAAGDRVALGRAVHALESAWAQRTGRPFEPVHVEPVEDQRHLRSAFDYILRNEAAHGLDADPEHDASSLPDMLGLRVLDPRAVTRVRALLPEVRRGRLLEILGVAELAPAFDPALLHAAAAAAIARASVDGHSSDRVAARIAATHLDAAPAADVAARLRVTPHTVRRLRRLPPDPALTRAIGLQMGLRAYLDARQPLLWEAG